MTAKEYLNQARYLDMRIDAKIQQQEALKSLATKATAVLTGMPHSSSPSHSRTEDIVIKIVALRDEINADIDRLVDLKDEIQKTIKAVEDVELQTILEKRYLCFQTWEKISDNMDIEIRRIYRMHGKALEEVRAILKLEK